MKNAIRIGVAVLILVAGAAGLWLLIENRPAPEVEQREVVLPVVRVVPAELRTVRLDVQTQGTVRPRTEIQLVPEVSGRVTWISPSLWAGGFFDEGEDLVCLDPRDFELQEKVLEAEVARAKLALALEEAEADAARREWERLEPEQEPSPLAVREPHLAEARARVAAAEASLRRAKLDVERTVLRAPFAGRARGKQVDVGQFVSRGTPIAELYAVDYAEVRLPLPDDELAFLDVALDASKHGPDVVLRAVFAGETHEWRGHIARIEGEIDPHTRMVHVVARVEDPYGRRDEGKRLPLAAGMFVRAQIEGRARPGTIVIPPDALRDPSRVLVVEEAAPPAENGAASEAVGRLRIRPVEMLRRERERVLIEGGLREGDLVCVSPLAEVIDGMRVRYAVAAEAEDGASDARPRGR